MTRELGDTIPALYANETKEDYDAVLAPAKLFSPLQPAGRWYITEWDRETGLCFGLVEGFEVELGYFDLDRVVRGDRLRRSSRRGARPLLAAQDHRRDQEGFAVDLSAIRDWTRRA